MALKNYEDGMEKGWGDSGKSQGYPGGATRNSKWALENQQPAEALSGDTPTGKFVSVSLSDTNPPNQTKLNPNEGDPNQ